MKIGDTASFQKTITEFDVYQFAGITGDFNPLHINQVKAEMMEAIRNQSLDADQVVDNLMVAKYLEKMGDHAVNIAKWTVFRMTGDIEGNTLY